MRSLFAAVLLCPLALLTGGRLDAASSSDAAVPALPPLNQASLSKGDLLRDAHRYVEAAAIYEDQLKLQPENPLLLARLAHALYMQGQLLSDSSQVQALNQRARTLAEQAQKFGATDPLTPMILAGIRPDGTLVEKSKGAYSGREEVEHLIRDGEAAFSRHDYTQAVDYYRKAFELEPTNYGAAVFVGDAYFASRQLEPACEWLRKAIAIDPDVETAHRYLGDAMAKQGSREEAYNEWIAALICDPYQRVTRQHFTSVMREAAASRGHVIPRFPAMRSKLEGKEIRLAVDSSDGVLIMSYNLCALGWRAKEFAEHFPQEKTPRRSLPEEIVAIDAMLKVAAEVKEADKTEMKKWEPMIDGLVALKSKGLLEAYVLIERADEGLIKDYVSYRAGHRDQLREYIWTYWCGFE